VTSYGDVRLKLFKPVVIKLSQDDKFSEAKPGTIIDVSRDCFTVKAGQNAVRFYEIQAPGSRRMKVSDYLLGHRLDIGACLGA
jgi:methionyl-tRNA formyltransferase